jgi:hypothetical protein
MILLNIRLQKGITQYIIGEFDQQIAVFFNYFKHRNVPIKIIARMILTPITNVWQGLFYLYGTYRTHPCDMALYTFRSARTEVSRVKRRRVR